MRLKDLNPIFTYRIDNGEKTEGEGVIFDCPCGNHDEAHRCYVPFMVPIGPGPVHLKDGWCRTGEDFDSLSLTPSIHRVKEKGGCGWHGYITNGEIKTV